MTTYQLESIASIHPTFNLVEQDKYLECPSFQNSDRLRIAVEIIRRPQESDSTQLLLGKDSPKRSWLRCCRPDHIETDISIHGKQYTVAVKVSEIANKWKLDPKEVRDKCQENELEELAASAIKIQDSSESYVSLQRPSNLTITSPSGNLDDSLPSQTWDPSTAKDSLTSESSVIVHEVEVDIEPKPPENRRAKSEWSLDTAHSVVESSDSGEEKTENLNPEKVLSQFPFHQLYNYLKQPPISRDKEKLITLVATKWPRINGLIEANKESWSHICQQYGVCNYVTKHHAFCIEYFQNGSVWVYFNCGLSPLALNVTTGTLCNRIVVGKEGQAPILFQVQKIGTQTPYVQSLTFSAFNMRLKGASVNGMNVSYTERKIFRFLTPIFITTLQHAKKSGFITTQNRLELAFHWIQGVAALHQQRIAFETLSSDSLLIQDEAGIIGGFGSANLIALPSEKLIVTDEAYRAVPVEDREDAEKLAFEETLKVAKSKNVLELGNILKTEIFPDLFAESSPASNLSTSVKDMTVLLKRAQVKAVITLMTKENPTERPSTEEVVRRWGVIMPKLS